MSSCLNKGNEQSNVRTGLNWSNEEKLTGGNWDIGFETSSENPISHQNVAMY